MFVLHFLQLRNCGFQNVDCQIMPETDHFNQVEGLSNPNYELTKLMIDQIKLSTQ